MLLSNVYLISDTRHNILKISWNFNVSLHLDTKMQLIWIHSDQTHEKDIFEKDTFLPKENHQKQKRKLKLLQKMKPTGVGL